MYCSWKTRWLEKLMKAVQLQIFIFFLSMPFFAWWNLSVSVMSLVGNILFTPCVVVFVFVSTMLFLTEFLGIPNGAVVAFLELWTRIWCWALSWGSKKWIVGVPSSLVFVSFLCVAVTLLIVLHRKWGQLVESTVILVGLYLFFCLFLYYRSLPDMYESLKKGRGEVKLFVCGNRVIIYDQDCFDKIRSPESWVEYTYVPWLLRTTGRVIVDELHLETLSVRSAQVVTIILDYCCVKKLVMRPFREILPYDEWCVIRDLYKKIEKERVVLEEITYTHNLQKQSVRRVS